jgi:hypothetical protein
MRMKPTHHAGWNSPSPLNFRRFDNVDFLIALRLVSGLSSWRWASAGSIHARGHESPASDTIGSIWLPGNHAGNARQCEECTRISIFSTKEPTVGHIHRLVLDGQEMMRSFLRVCSHAISSSAGKKKIWPSLARISPFQEKCVGCSSSSSSIQSRSKRAWGAFRSDLGTISSMGRITLLPARILDPRQSQVKFSKSPTALEIFKSVWGLIRKSHGHRAHFGLHQR